MGARIVVELEDVRGSVARLVRDAPKKARQFLSTAVFQTAAGVERQMDSLVQLGPDGEGLTPGEHIKFDIEHRGRNGALSAQVGIFDNADQVKVAMFNEYAPNRQAFMKPAAANESDAFRQRAMRALEQMERVLSQGW